MPRQEIVIRNAREHNLKGVSLEIPKNKLVVITGPSGSGKSSLAFDTLYAEGQRRYVESLSSYARQFLGVQKKPDVDDIEGLSPAISIEQKGTSHNPRSTVGTVTEIYDYLRLLFARAGTPYCPRCGKPVHKYSVDEIVDRIYRQHGGARLEVLAPVVRAKKGEFKNVFAALRKKGFMRVRVDGEVLWLEEEIPLDKNKKHSVEVVVDRMSVQPDRKSRMAEAVQTALQLGEGFVIIAADGTEDMLTERFVCPDCGVSLPDIQPALFSFNNPMGACPDCSGLGSHSHFSEELAVNPDLSVRAGALLPFRGKQYMMYRLEELAKKVRLDLDTPYKKLAQEQKQILLYGSDVRMPLQFERGGEISEYQGRYEGLLPWLQRYYDSTESETTAEELERYRSEDECQTCHGTRLRPEALSVRFWGKNIDELTSLPVSDFYEIVRQHKDDPGQNEVVSQVIVELEKRLSFLVEVGVGYLTLKRRADTLSGGESQRIRLATQIGSKLSGVMYVLDEPTIGLHSRDTGKLIGALKSVRDMDNTVIVVEHDRDTMLAADYIVEIGPGAGSYGGEVVQRGAAEEFRKTNSLTGPYLRGDRCGMVRSERLALPKERLEILGAAEHNLKGVDVSIPLNSLVCLTGVSGSGKSSLMYDVLYRGLRRKLDADYRDRPGRHKDILGWERLKNVAMVDQSPIGRTPRSNPATYTGVFSAIRELYSQLPEAKLRGYASGRFSFNVKGGRCEACGGAGERRVSMLFMPDVYVECDVCHGTRYNRETLEVKFKGHSIADVLNLSVDEAMELFKDLPKIARKLEFLQRAGLGYIHLGQSALTLSGGEAQRVKLAKELSKRFGGSTLYLLDEPSTGLFYPDVGRLLRILHALVDQGNSVLLIEHNMDIICSSDYVIDLGPEGGSAGGRVVDCGAPRELAERGRGYTAAAIREYLHDFEKSGEVKGDGKPRRKK
ncbi:excinuclease ABC subunit UvrA [Pyramidobacter piscolens]|uniref:excinuclease ABC subunit UvrA n=1 Tax=Pyramidobacter piscolens TaxID=638849 RepID=UPI0028ECDFA6|nr:excinuclease ABC subunit UvrA [Pyramidobacter piscolens]